MKIKDISWLLLVVLTMATLGTSQPQDEEEAEELPDAEPYRMSRPSYNRATFAGNRVGGSNSLSSRVDQGFSDSDVLDRDDYYDPYGSESSYGGGGGGGGYGGYASESGYGYSLTKYVDCNSAIAILSLILFLDILRDIVQDLTTTNKRKRRASHGAAASMSQFLMDGGADAVIEGIPDIIIPLLHELHEATYDDQPFKKNDEHEYSDNECVQESLCKANFELADRFGGMGRVVGALLSNVVAKAFIGSESLLLHDALEASKWGRRGTDCHYQYHCAKRFMNSTLTATS